MIDFIPLQYYSLFYFYFLLFISFLVFLWSKSILITDSKNITAIRFLGFLLLFFNLFYIGFRPISIAFGDMAIYDRDYQNYVLRDSFIPIQDVGFDFFMYSCSRIMNASMFFFLCSFLYVLPLWYACKKWFKSYFFYGFFILITSFSFWAYAVNGIRNGIATSIFLYALSRDKMITKFFLIIIAISFHKSVIIPTVALVLTLFYANPKKFFYGWLACIPLSLLAGGFWESLFAGFMDDDRSRYLTTFKEQFKDSFSSSGFRWDFLLYSASAVFAAYYFIFKKKYEDPIYNRLVCVYLAANAFWILVIRASFSNRFAYLSWFMMGIIIVYPFLTKIQIKNQHRVLGTVLLAYFGFTFLMNVILA